MGRLKELYGEADEERKAINLDLPLVGMSIKMHRPHSDEKREIEKRSNAYKGDEDQPIWKRVMVLKYLSDEPNLREEDEVALFEDIKDMEIPDQKAIDNIWDVMNGEIPSNLRDAVGHQLFQQASGTETG